MAKRRLALGNGGKRKRGRTRPPRKRFMRKLTLGGFPDSKTVRLRYVTTVTLDPATGSIPVAYYRANGCYDPEVAVGGHQPRGFDEWIGIYDHFTVLGSKIRVTPFSDFASGADVPNFGVALRDDASFPYSTFSDLAESRLAGPGIMASWRSLGTKSATKKYSTKKFFSVKDYISKGLYRGTATSDPSELAVFALWCTTPDKRDIAPVKFIVQIDYIVAFTEPKYLAGS